MKAEKSIQYTVEDFIKIEAEATKILHDKTELSFNQRLILYNESIIPIIKWANNNLQFALAEKNMKKDDFERWCDDVENQPTLLFENEIFSIRGVLDYDLGAKFCNFTVTDKKTNFNFKYTFFFRKI